MSKGLVSLFFIITSLSACSESRNFKEPAPQATIEACEISLLSDGGSISMCFKVEGEVTLINWNGKLGSERPCAFDVVTIDSGEEHVSSDIEVGSESEEAVILLLDRWLDNSPRKFIAELQPERDDYERVYVASINRVKELIKNRDVSPYCK